MVKFSYIKNTKYIGLPEKKTLAMWLCDFGFGFG